MKSSRSHSVPLAEFKGRAGFGAEAFTRGVRSNARWSVLLILLSLFAASCGRPLNVEAQAEPSGADLHLDRTAEVFEERASEGFVGAVVIRSAGQQVFEATAGEAGPGIPFTEHTAIDIASITKPITAMAILKLAEQGRLGLDDPIERWFPEAPSDKRRITLRQLLSHSSGVVNFLEEVLDYTPITADEMARQLLEAPLVFAPGSTMEYSNGGFNLLGIVVERASGVSLSSYLEEHVFRPVGVTAFYDPERFPAARVAGTQRDGEWFDVRNMAAARNGPFWGLWGAGGLYISAADLALLTEAFMQGRIVGQALVSEALSPVIASPRTNAQMGLGWMLYQVREGLQAYHNGGSRRTGSSTEIRYYAGLGVTMLSVSNQGSGAGLEMGQLIRDAALRTPPEER